MSKFKSHKQNSKTNLKSIKQFRMESKGKIKIEKRSKLAREELKNMSVQSEKRGFLPEEGSQAEATIPTVSAASTTVTIQPQQTVKRQLGSDLAVTITPYAWQKLRYMRDKSSNEIGFFAITDKDNPLAIVDIFALKQEVSVASVEFDGEDIIRFYLKCDEKGWIPAQYTRIWVHTHPGNSATPSGVDEDTFTKVWGNSDWAVMIVVGRDDTTTVKLRYNVGIPADFPLKLRLDYTRPFPASDMAAWDQEFTENVHTRQYAIANQNWDRQDHMRPYSYPYGYGWDEENTSVYDPLTKSWKRAGFMSKASARSARDDYYSATRHTVADLWDIMDDKDQLHFLANLKIEGDVEHIYKELEQYWVYDKIYAGATVASKIAIYRSTGCAGGICFDQSLDLPSVVTFLKAVEKTNMTVTDALKVIKQGNKVPAKEMQETAKDIQDDLYLDNQRNEIEAPQSETSGVSALAICDDDSDFGHFGG